MSISNFSIVVLGPMLRKSLICCTAALILCEKIHTHTKIMFLTESVVHIIFFFTIHSPLADGVLLLLMRKLLVDANKNKRQAVWLYGKCGNNCLDLSSLTRELM